MRKKLILIMAVSVFLFSSCTQTINNTADEIRLNRWSSKFRNGSLATLSFDGDRAYFTVKSEDESARVRLNGLCVFDGEKFAIYDESDKSEYVFRYKLRENKLILVYDGGKVALKRQ